MLKVMDGENVSYIFTEKERASFASKESLDFIKERIANLDNFVGTKIDFFTGNEIQEDNVCSFNVEKDGVMYSCAYDTEHEPENIIQREARKFLMWRNGDCGFYYEVIGNYIEDGKITTIDNTPYNDCEDYIYRFKEGLETDPYEELELNESNKEELKKYLFSDLVEKDIKTTQEYFGLSLDELLEIRNEYGYTREECKLYDEGLEIVFFDSEKEFQDEEEQFKKYMESKRYEIKVKLKTINERLAIVLV